MTSKRLPLQYWVPGALVLLAVALTALAFVHDFYRSNRGVERLTRRRTMATGNLVVPALERWLGQGKPEEARGELARLMLVPDLVRAVVVDEQGSVLLASEARLRGQRIEETAWWGAGSLLERSRTTRTAHSEVREGRSIFRAAFPFPLGLLPGELRASRIAVLLVEADLAGPKRAEMTGILQRSLAMGLASLLVCLVGWRYFHRTFTLRFNLLLTGVEAYATDQRRLQVPSEGDDELARIGTAVNRLASDLAARETALRESEARKAGILESVSDGLITLDLSGRVVDWNAGAARIFGSTAASAAGRDLVDLVVPARWRAHYRAELLERLALGPEPRVRVMEWTTLGPEGDEFPVEVSLAPINAEPPLFTVFLRDLTERRRAEEAVKRLDLLLREVIDLVPHFIFAKDAQGRYLFVNRSTATALGLRPDQMTGLTDRELSRHPGEAEAVMRDDREVLAAGRMKKVPEETLTDVHGQPRVYQTVKIPFEDPGTNQRAVLGVAVDITREVQLESQLRHAQKMDAVGQLAGGVAHDFNNLLAVITLQTALASSTPGLPADVEEALAEIRGAAERAVGLTRQLLLFSRRQLMQAKTLDLNEAVNSLVRLLQRIIGADVQLRVQLHSEALPVRADPGMIDQVLMNLAVNARDAMPKGGQLTVETDSQELTQEAGGIPPGRYARLRVTDTGVGIAAEVLPRIFEPFFTTKGVGEGTGLGLATVFGIVKQHQGFLKVASTPGQGATFEVLLPAGIEAHAIKSSGTTPPARRGAGELILVVEDEPSVRAATVAVLERHGYRVRSAADGATALAHWPELAEDVAMVLTDLVMPGGVSGRMLAERLRAITPGLKVVFTSGYNPDAAGPTFEPMAGETFLLKPIAMHDLLETVRRTLDAGS